MLSTTTKKLIESQASHITSSQFFKNAKSGSVSQDTAACYLRNLSFLFRNSVDLLRTVENTARDSDFPELALLYAEKYDEEAGHHHWAQEDLASLGRNQKIDDSNVILSMQNIVSFMKNLAETDSISYLSYMVLVEYITVLVGPDLLKNLEDNCGIPTTSMTAIDKHIEVDIHHADEGFELIDRFAEDHVDHEEFLRIEKEAFDLVYAFFEELAGASEEHQAA